VSATVWDRGTSSVSPPPPAGAGQPRQPGRPLHDLRPGRPSPVGTALLVQVDQHAGTAEFGLTIGERRNQGLGTEATRLVLDWAFRVMGLHNILLVTFSWNLPAIRAYTKAGFREIGRRRGAVVTYSQRHDQVLMDAVADEFTDSASARQRPPNAQPPGHT
jgi:RimJ/RimL family protein N-acetyltransferase